MASPENKAERLHVGTRFCGTLGHRIFLAVCVGFLQLLLVGCETASKAQYGHKYPSRFGMCRFDGGPSSGSLAAVVAGLIPQHSLASLGDDPLGKQLDNALCAIRNSLSLPDGSFRFPHSDTSIPDTRAHQIVLKELIDKFLSESETHIRYGKRDDAALDLACAVRLVSVGNTLPWRQWDWSRTQMDNVERLVSSAVRGTATLEQHPGMAALCEAICNYDWQSSLQERMTQEYVIVCETLRAFESGAVKILALPPDLPPDAIIYTPSADETKSARNAVIDIMRSYLDAVNVSCPPEMIRALQIADGKFARACHQNKAVSFFMLNPWSWYCFAEMRRVASLRLEFLVNVSTRDSLQEAAEAFSSGTHEPWIELPQVLQTDPFSGESFRVIAHSDGSVEVSGDDIRHSISWPTREEYSVVTFGDEIWIIMEDQGIQDGHNGTQDDNNDGDKSKK